MQQSMRISAAFALFGLAGCEMVDQPTSNVIICGERFAIEIFADEKVAVRSPVEDFTLTSISGPTGVGGIYEGWNPRIDENTIVHEVWTASDEEKARNPGLGDWGPQYVTIHGEIRDALNERIVLGEDASQRCQ